MEKDKKFVNIIDEIRDCIFKASFKAEAREASFIEEILTPLRESNEEEYEKIVNILVGDYYKILITDDVMNALEDSEKEYLELINECQNNDDIQFLFMDNNYFAESSILAFQDYCAIEQPTKIVIYNFVNNNYKEKLLQINPYSIYEEQYAILNGYNIENYDKEKLVNIFDYIANFYEADTEVEKYGEFIESLCFFDNKIYERIVYDIIEDSYLLNKWKQNLNDVVDDDDVDYDLINEVENNKEFDSLNHFSKNVDKFEDYLFDFVEYNCMHNELEQNLIRNTVEKKDSKKILKKIKKNINNPDE